ncbi:piggyBac transposable element-derived protein 1-like [Hydra vulgaris]|uniref:piggyBac transposable element-derived protein 1-like n=1 Tax=Hydra vulgaris TaxID=6087 RepID=UPI001F5E4CF4|nr:piggyBac transposable element-derived protein 1-like [Hydra vulgaris]
MEFEALEYENDPDNDEPIYFFRKFITNELLDIIVNESNKYAVQSNPNDPLKITRAELEQFIGILFATCLMKMPSTRMYWSKEFYFNKVADVMTLKRFEKIKSKLQCSDNLSRQDNCSDKLYKIRPVIDYLKYKFVQLRPYEQLCIDEQIVPFKGKSNLKEYNPKKPKQWGYKLYVLSETDGLVHNFEIYTGSIGTCPNQPDLKASGNIVLILLQNIPRKRWHKLYFDNWYTSLPLVKLLHTQGNTCLETVRSNRLLNCKMSSDKDMKKDGRGSVELWTTDSDGVELRAIKWFDNRCVILYMRASIPPQKSSALIKS